MTVAAAQLQLISSDITASQAFFTGFLGFSVHYSNDWLKVLNHAESALQLSLIRAGSDRAPADVRGAPGGYRLSFAVDNLDDVYQQALSQGLSLEGPPQNTEYGRRRLLLNDPGGIALELTTPQYNG